MGKALEFESRPLFLSDFRARAAATKVLCYWRDRVRSPLELLRTQINDSHPRVRLEAIRALSFFHGEAPLTVAVELLSHPDDEYIRFVFNETMATLERRLGAGKLDRGNIAASIVQMLEKGKVPPDRMPLLVETVARHGGPKELQAIWARAQTKEGYPPQLRRRVFEWLAEAADTRRAQPKIEVASIRKLLSDAASDESLLKEAIRLTSAWKVKEAAADLRGIARDATAKTEIRQVAIDGLASLADAESKDVLADLTGAKHAAPIRFSAAVALARLDLEAGSRAAAKALASAGDADDPSGVVEAFLTRKGGPERLAAALAGEKLSADNAKRILRAMYLAGRNDPPLASVVSKAAGLDVSGKPPTSEEIRELGKEALAKGDIRGERIFRRADLGCVKCHSVNKVGGSIGPDLGPIGGSSPMDYIVESILDPNAAIKEEYLTKVLNTASGQVLLGVVVERNKNLVAIKDATGKITRIPADEIDDEAVGKSLMPEGVTRILTKAELLDVIRFVSELGKPGPLAPRPITTLQRWQRLRDMPTALLEGVPNRDELRDMVLGVGPDAWESVYSLFDGTLPLDELRKPTAPNVLYLQGEIVVLEPGRFDFKLSDPKRATLWIDENQFDKPAKAIAKLEVGRHRITVRVELEEKTPNLRLEVTTPLGSRSRFEFVHGE